MSFFQLVRREMQGSLGRLAFVSALGGVMSGTIGVLAEEQARTQPFEIDLVLDIGNSRTCGILIEDDRGARMNLNN